MKLKRLVVVLSVAATLRCGTALAMDEGVLTPAGPRQNYSYDPSNRLLNTYR